MAYENFERIDFYGDAMAQVYRVTFFKNLLSPDGHPFKCPQKTIEVHRARSSERALAAAQHRYQRLNKDRNWTLHADTAEIVSVADDKRRPQIG